MFLPGNLSLILPNFFALNQHLRHDHERTESPHPGPSNSEESSEQQVAVRSVQATYTELDFLGMMSQGSLTFS